MGCTKRRSKLTMTACARQPGGNGRNSFGSAELPIRAFLTTRQWQKSLWRRTSYLVADIAHISGLIVAGAHPNPVAHCDVVTSTSHKSIRGPRGGFILSKNEDRYQALYHPTSKHNLAKRIDRAVFPQLQGGPHMNIIAALAVALQEAATPSFRVYGHQIVKNAKALAEALLESGL